MEKPTAELQGIYWTIRNEKSKVIAFFYVRVFKMLWDKQKQKQTNSKIETCWVNLNVVFFHVYLENRSTI